MCGTTVEGEGLLRGPHQRPFSLRRRISLLRRAALALRPAKPFFEPRPVGPRPAEPHPDSPASPAPLEDMMLYVCMTSCAVLLGWATTLSAVPPSARPTYLVRPLTPSPAPSRASAASSVSALRT